MMFTSGRVDGLYSSVSSGNINQQCWCDSRQFPGRVWVNEGEIAGNGIDDDGNGRRGEVGWGMENPGCDSSLIVDVRAERRRHWAPFKTGRG